MSKSWLILLVLMVASNFLVVMMGSITLSILLDVLIFVAAHFLFKKDPYVDYKTSMIFIGILTVINILDVLNLVQHFVIREGLIALLIWGWFGANNRFFRLFVLGSCVFNGVQIMNLYRETNMIDINTSIISLIALLLVAYFDSKKAGFYR